MNRRRVRYSVTGAIVFASVAAPLLVQCHALVQWRERELLFQQQARQLAELSAENARLSNLIARSKRPSLPADQFVELMRLRGEIGGLRQNAGEVAKLQAAHQRLLAASRSSEPHQSLPDPQTVLAYWPKAQLTYSGYAEPVSALQTALSAMNSNDPNALAASVTPEAKSKLIEVGSRAALWVLSRSDPDALAGSVAPETKYQALMDQISPADRMAFQAKAAADSLGPASGFYVVGQELFQDGANLDVYFGTEGATRVFGLKKIGEEWKVDGVYLVSREVGKPRRGAMIWP
jgi:hypothetical protein